jgi:hypothetical protein
VRHISVEGSLSVIHRVHRHETRGLAARSAMANFNEEPLASHSGGVYGLTSISENLHHVVSYETFHTIKVREQTEYSL